MKELHFSALVWCILTTVAALGVPSNTSAQPRSKLHPHVAIKITGTLSTSTPLISSFALPAVTTAGASNIGESTSFQDLRALGAAKVNVRVPINVDTVGDKVLRRLSIFLFRTGDSRAGSTQYTARVYALARDVDPTVKRRFGSQPRVLTWPQLVESIDTTLTFNLNGQRTNPPTAKTTDFKSRVRWTSLSELNNNSVATSRIRFRFGPIRLTEQRSKLRARVRLR